MSKAQWSRYGVVLGGLTLGAMLVVASGVAAPRSASGRPSISSFTPRSGPVGTQVAIRGTNLLGGSVSFNGVPTSVNVTYSGDDGSDYELTATVPKGATTGAITVTTSGGVATNHVLFTVTPGNVSALKGKPIVSGFEPATARPGAMITISGENLGPLLYVKVGGVKVKFYKPLSPTRVAVRIPTGARTGKIRLATPLGAAMSSDSLLIG